MKKAAIISRQGLGDGLIMMICAQHLKNSGYNVTFYHRLFHELTSFFPEHEFLDFPNLKNHLKAFSPYDLIIIEHYNHPLIKNLLKYLKSTKNLFVIYPSYKKKKRKELPPNAFVCNEKKSMTQNLTEISSLILNKNNLKKTNGIVFPSHLIHRKHSKRIVIHPSSTDPKKNWKKVRFLKLYKKLSKMGFDPVFSLAPHEKHLWVDKTNIKIKTSQDFSELASFIYESGFLIGNDSGPAHLASNLNIPTIVIASNARLMRLWKPDFFPTTLLTAPSILPNMKGLRIKDNLWQFFISVRAILKTFQKIQTNLYK